jgi:hypothetical protein
MLSKNEIRLRNTSESVYKKSTAVLDADYLCRRTISNLKSLVFTHQMAFYKRLKGLEAIEEGQLKSTPDSPDSQTATKGRFSRWFAVLKTSYESEGWAFQFLLNAALLLVQVD